MFNVLRSFKNAFSGLLYCFATQRNMVIHALTGLVVIALGLSLRVNIYGMLFLISAIMLVLVSEAFNTAIEKTIDLYTEERSSLAQIAKDVAAGAVLLTTVYAVLVGLVFLGLPFWQFLKSL